jgi:ferric-dicitrate binding protein FerR (iron transport regulator)
VTKAGERLFIRLPDGSTAVLNGQSRLRYVYSTGHRNVFLKGEAYFTVKHNARRPFIVHTGNVNTKDIGTVFNVNAYPDEENILVTVVSGSVAVSDSLHHYGLLRPKDQLVYHRQSAEAVIQKVDPANFTAWKEGKLIFDGVRLSEVVKCFKRTYNVDINIDSRLKNCPLYADFSNLDIEKSIRLIAESLNARYEKTGNGYRITGGGCK